MSILHSSKVLITGATGGLGGHLASYFINNNHPLIITSRSNKKLINLKESLVFNDVDIQYYKCDMLKIEEIMQLSKFCINNGINVLINNAGITCPGKNLSEYNIEEINKIIGVNLTAPIILSKLLSPYLSDIININSMVGLEHKKYRTLYSASKWGLRGFSESYKKEIKNLNILDVYPSNIRTWPNRKNAMDAISVVSKIYESFQNKESHLVIDGRLKK